MLRSELARSEPDIVPALHERASAWHLRSGSAGEAIIHALAAGDADGAAGLIARHWLAHVDSGRMETVRGWLRSLGDDRIAARPPAAHVAAWAAALSGDQGSVRRWLPVLQAAPDHGPLPDGMRSLEFSAALLEATFGFDGIARMREAGAAAVRLETNPASPWYPLARTVFGAALYYCGEFDQAAAQAEQARRSNTPIALVRMNAFALSALAAVDAGRNAQAQEFARRARDIATDPDQGLSGVPQTVMAHVASGAVLAARGRLPEARAEFEDTLRARRAWAGISPWPTVELLLTLAPVLGGLGDRAEAGARLDEARRLLTELPDGAGHQLARLERVERQLAGRSRAASPAEPLTERERAVLRLFQGNITLREIGSELYLSQNTVKTHAQAIYRKLGWTCITATVAGQPGFYRLLDQFQDFALQVVSINQLSPLAADPRPASW